MGESVIESMPGGFQDALNIVANYEPTAATWLGLQALGSATRTDIDKELIGKIGFDTRYHHAIERCAVPHGFAAVSKGPSRYSKRIVSYFYPARIDDALPMIGTTLQWAADHELPLYPFLSNTRMDSGARQRAPMNSIQIYASILTNTPVIDSRQYRRPDRRFAINRLDEMQRANIIEVDEGINRFMILDPVYRGTKPLETLSPETQAVYDALAIAKDSVNQDSWSVDEIVSIAAARNEAHDEDWVARLRKCVRRAAYATETRDFHGAIEKKEYQYGRYTLNPKYADAVDDLLHQISRLSRTGSRNRKRAASQALSFYDDVDSISTIVRRGLNAYPNRHHKPNGVVE